MHYPVLLYVCILLLSYRHVSAQEQLQPFSDPLQQQFHLYNLARPTQTLFVHFDKNIYTNNETVWFTGYLLNERRIDIAKHNILSVALIRDIDSTVVKQQKFIMAYGLSYGSMAMPDSLLAGNYHFFVSTNRVSNGMPDASYSQPIIVKTNINQPFNANLKMLEPGIAGKKPNQVLVSVTTQDARFLPRPVTINYRYGKVSKRSSTNSSGELIMKLDEQENLTDPNLYLKLTYGKDSSFLNLALPVTKQRAKVSFYPEGGNLINGISGKIGWEVKDQQLAVATLKAQLFKDDQIIDTIETNSNGIGRFVLTPQKNSRYQVKLMHSGFTDSTYLLPVAIDNAPGLSVNKALVTDTLRVSLKTQFKSRVFVRVHNFRETFIYKDIVLTEPGLNLKVSLENVPKGLNTITISDSIGRPLAERLFFAHYNPTQKISVSTDQQNYGKREKVTLALKLNKQDSIGVVSVACVQNGRLSPKLTQDIESYTYLASQLNSLPPYNNLRGYEDPEYMEDILLVKGWSRYSWTDLMKTTAADTLMKYDDTSLGLQVTEIKRPTTKPVEIVLLKPNGLALYTTNEQGNFNFPLNDLILEKEKPIHVFVGEKHKDKYQLKIRDPYERLNKSYLSLFAPGFRSVPSSVPNNRILAVKSNEGAFQLKEVEIKARNADDIKSRLMGANRCGDYVCRYNILNCTNHGGDPANTQPIPGRSYHSRAGTVIYQACTEPDVSPGMVPMSGIYTKKEFYINDYAEPLEPAFASTLYWNNGIRLNEKIQEVIFYTSDITGKFSIIVQGIGNGGVLYGDYTFEVKGK